MGIITLVKHFFMLKRPFWNFCIFSKYHNFLNLSWVYWPNDKKYTKFLIIFVISGKTYPSQTLFHTHTTILKFWYFSKFWQFLKSKRPSWQNNAKYHKFLLFVICFFIYLWFAIKMMFSIFLLTLLLKAKNGQNGAVNCFFF